MFETLLKLPNVADVRSNFALRTVKEPRPVAALAGLGRRPASHWAYRSWSSRLAASWRLVDFAAVRGSFQAAGSASSASSVRSACLGRLDLGLELLGLPAAGSSTARPGWGGALAGCGFGGFARLAVRSASARSSRTRTYSGQPPT